jgi:aspartyl-tRNA(Asn)/glutamyl-tRNA(Gln) amidotransferase subunit C
LDDATVRRIAALARIAISTDEAERARTELNGILTLIEQMQSVDTAGVEPMAHALDVAARLRPDEATEPDQRAAFQAVAPQVEQGLYLVPRVIE